MIPFSVSAQGETGTILDTTIEGIETDGNGNYYLTGDVTVTATYADEFTGTFDGKGYTVTTSVPLFNKVNGATIKNLTVEGAVTGYAAIASCVTGANKTVFENVINKADVTNTTATLTDGGFGLESTVVPAGGIGFLIYEAKCDFVGCVNEGDVTSDRLSAGIVSYVYTGEVSVSNCKNSGTITGNGDSAAGLVATSATNSTVMIENSENTGSISGAKYVGGIFGSTPTKANSNLSITKCSNSGAINSTSTRSGGIVGYLKNKDAGYNISYCYNTASVTAAAGNQECGGIVGCLADTVSRVEGCYNSGVITGGQAAQIYWNTSTDDRGLNYYLSDGSDSVLAPYYSSGSGYTGTAKSYSENELESGKLAYTMNTAIGKTVYYQNVNAGTTTDDHPVLDSTHGHVFESGDDYYSIAFYTLNKASIRLRADHSGLRFATAVSVEDYNALKDKFTLSFGTLITPDAYLDVALGGGYSFTKDGLANLDTENPYLDVTPAGEGTEVFNPLEGEDTKYYYFCGSITGIKEGNYGWDYSAIGYVSINGTEVYSADYATKNIAYIANLAYNDRQATQSTTYKYEIAADSEYAIGNKVSYSPYSPSECENTIDELKIIRGYL